MARTRSMLCDSFVQPSNPLNKPSTDPKHAQRTPAPLLDLPAEVILSVVDFLPKISVACLALCNRYLSQVIGHSAWASVRHQSKAARINFSSLLAKDLPQYFNCPACPTLHPTSAVSSWSWTARTCQILPCVRHSRAFTYHGLSWFKLKFAHIQLVMKRHHHGAPHGIALEALTHTAIRFDKRRQLTTLFSVEARIVDDDLLMRFQQWLFLPHAGNELFPKDPLSNARPKTHFPKHLLPYLCPHLTCFISAKLWPLLRARRESHTDTARSPRTPRCNKCLMDYSLETLDLGGKGVAVGATKWLDFGAGITPKDPKWLRHLDTSKDCYPSRAPRRSKPESSHVHGSIKTRFESQDGMSLEELTALNISRLFSDRQCKSVTQAPDGMVWKWRTPLKSSWWWDLDPS
ncbi:hypothetical protein M430DRAFT_16902 [Amorphotheca resinae ATCC 22711]|uniref:F-box domain-containing protein n=1 Tax=Amorphotheca resinae ATCC 22711 TaxID=857342 RepID=A0A2T3B7V4_AMORE|nr:hypothetical protein M430DRAFT_16902 [Amorphotheca resinae ATCC 22711]PSS22958.1 hypothetical protein M430DRAFT_16902 [Amorphotheca resinae ATCC 22711]